MFYHESRYLTRNIMEVESLSQELSQELSEDEVEHLVVEIIDDRLNKRRQRHEWLVTWADGSQTWEPKENLVDPDGTELLELIRYNVKKDVEKAKEEASKLKELYILFSFPLFTS